MRQILMYGLAVGAAIALTVEPARAADGVVWPGQATQAGAGRTWVVTARELEADPFPAAGARAVAAGHPEIEDGYAVLPRDLPPRPAGVRLGGAEIIEETTLGRTAPVPLVQQLGVEGVGNLDKFVPYDASIAVGGPHVLTVTNDGWAGWTKSSGTQFALHTWTEWFRAGATMNLFDPRAFYDVLRQRFVFVCVGKDDAARTCSLYVSVTLSSTLTSGFVNRVFDITSDGGTSNATWLDFPMLGYDNDRVYVSGNMFTFDRDEFQFAKIRVLPKETLYGIGSVPTTIEFTRMTDADGALALCLAPAMSLSSTTTEFLVDSKRLGGSSVQLWKIVPDKGPLGVSLVRLGVVACGAYALPPTAKQCGVLVPDYSAGDCRVAAPSWLAGTLYTGFTEAYDDVSAVRLLTINTSTATRVRDLTYGSSGNGAYYSYPGIGVDALGNVYIAASRSSTHDCVSATAIGLRAADTAFPSATMLREGVDAYWGGRWGDYNGAAADPQTTGIGWTLSGYAARGGDYHTWISRDAFSGASPKAGAALQTFALVTPAPAHPEIRFTLAGSQPATVTIYTAGGRLVSRIPVPGARAGENAIRWDGRDAAGREVPAGLYLTEVEAGAERLRGRVLRAVP